MRTRKILSALTAALAGAALLASGPSAAADTSCTDISVPVSLAPGQPATQTIAGSLCAPGSADRVDLLVHGGTYNSAYWDWPQQPGLYSYVRKTNEAGRATLAFDRLGTGDSTRPSSAALTLTADAHVVHQLVQWLRAHGFDEVTLIGHSLGSMVVISEAATYQDVDRLIVTGAVHLPGLGGGVAGLFGSFYPAALDPQFAGQVTDLGYLTTQPGTRGSSFYRQPPADPAVIAYDEGHKDIMSGVELTDAAAKLTALPGLSDANQVDVPVLTVVGQYDVNLCGVLLNCSADENIRANEAPYYTSAPSLTGMAIPDTGHCLTLHPSAGVSFARINDWINTH